MTVVNFECPGCSRSCQLDEAQRGLRHAEPVCELWRKHKDKPQDFLVLALRHASVARGNLIIGGTKDLGERATDAELRKERAETLEQIYEGMKKL